MVAKMKLLKDIRVISLDPAPSELLYLVLSSGDDVQVEVLLEKSQCLQGTRNSFENMNVMGLEEGVHFVIAFLNGTSPDLVKLYKPNIVIVR